MITVEPGIYIPEDSPCDSKWWGIAVRIEDDILITNDGPVNLSAFAPRTAEGIEVMMQQPSVLDAFVLPELDSLGQYVIFECLIATQRSFFWCFIENVLNLRWNV